MRLLIDTHTFLWFVNYNPELSDNALRIITNPDNNVFMSVASFWEMAIKISTGKLVLPGQFETLISQQLTDNEITLLNISIPHIAVVSTLPLHHRDPFDRMLVAQSMVEQIPIVSRDAALDSYPIKRLW